MSLEEMREHQRTPVRWRAALILAGNPNQICKGLTIEVSKGGVGLYTEKQIPVGTHAKLMLEIPGPAVGSKTHLQQDVQVVHSSLIGNISQFRTGLRFKNLSAENERILSRFIRS